jgi:uncharacterized protein DUF2784
MWYRLLADLLVLAHFGYVLFVILGGLLVLRHPRLAWLHLPAAAWGATIEFTGWICPLTPWEQSLRRLGGQAGYTGGFVEHYLVPVLYPSGLTAPIQLILGLFVVTVNAAIYAVVLRRYARQRARSGARR